MHERLRDVPLQAGTLLLVHGPSHALDALADEPGLVPLSEVTRAVQFRPRVMVSLLIMPLNVLLAAVAGVLIPLFWPTS